MYKYIVLTEKNDEIYNHYLYVFHHCVFVKFINWEKMSSTTDLLSDLIIYLSHLLRNWPTVLT